MLSLSFLEVLWNMSNRHDTVAQIETVDVSVECHLGIHEDIQINLILDKCYAIFLQC